MTLPHRIQLALRVLIHGTTYAPSRPRVECPQRHPTSGMPCILGADHNDRRCLSDCCDRWVAERRRFHVPALGAVWRWR
jgi:hypothetical protein